MPKVMISAQAQAHKALGKSLRKKLIKTEALTTVPQVVRTEDHASQQ